MNNISQSTALKVNQVHRFNFELAPTARSITVRVYRRYTVNSIYY